MSTFEWFVTIVILLFISWRILSWSVLIAAEMKREKRDRKLKEFWLKLDGEFAAREEARRKKQHAGR